MSSSGISEQAKSGGSRAHVRADARNHKIDIKFFRRLWKLLRPYWMRRGGWRSWLTLGTLLALGMAGAAAGGFLSYLTAAQTNALVAKHVAAYWSLWLRLTGFGLIIFAAATLQTFLSGYLNLHWRKWLTEYLIDEYLQHRTYYEITIDQDIDNPDQRIQEQVMPFCETLSNFPQQLLNTLTSMAVQIGILMSISPGMFVATVVYAVTQTVLTLYLYRPTIRQNWDITVAEADLRYGLLHVRDNAETIAFYRGEGAERKHLAGRLGTAIKMQLRLIRYRIALSSVSQISSLSWGVLPMVLIAPLYFQGKIAYGTIFQGVVAASLTTQALSVLTQYIPNLSQMVPVAVRLAEITEKFEALDAARRPATAISRIRFGTADNIVVEHLTLHTPGGEQTLLRDLSFTLEPGQHLLITGQTGVGKSSLLRAMAGLWSRGEGRVAMPPAEQLMFLPQQPYMILGNLRDQLLYPNRWRNPRDKPSDAALKNVLERVCLPKLLAIAGGLDAEQDWGHVLSLGEQQRIAFARVLLAPPHFVFLDEATSAVDAATEAALYHALLMTQATLVSVGHRASLTRFHRQTLDLTQTGWRLSQIEPPPASDPIIPFHSEYSS